MYLCNYITSMICYLKVSLYHYNKSAFLFLIDSNILDKYICFYSYGKECTLKTESWPVWPWMSQSTKHSGMTQVHPFFPRSIARWQSGPQGEGTHGQDRFQAMLAHPSCMRYFTSQRKVTMTRHALIDENTSYNTILWRMMKRYNLRTF